ncbi:MAG: hypothetical protein M1818_003048 [Claussenomyces sp. TS43310]|nr:MAG: hypothetical protein M1818_003048 [Claussenomyces sp. TS43310]
MELTSLLALMVAGFIAAPRMVVALSSGDAPAMYEAYNNAFLYTSGSTAYYKKSSNVSEEDGSWTEDLDINVVLDAYENTGDGDKLALINDLLTTWLSYNPPPWNADGWNDDVGWYTLALIRAYQYTGTTDFLNQAQAGYDMAFARGWDTAHNGGGIWELQPEDDSSPANKCILSNNSLGRVACLIYQSTNNATYLDQCTQIYDWVWRNLYVPSTGEVYGCIEQDGTIDYGDDPYNQGSMADMANMLWLINNDESFLNDAKLAISYAFSNVTVKGIFSNTSPSTVGWTDDLTRAVGRTVSNNRLWDTYYSSMVDNADAIVQNKRADLGITWNGWDTPTPDDTSLQTTQAAGAAAWLWWVPASQPNDTAGLHVITNQQTGLAIDSMGTYGSGQSVNQWQTTGSQNQRWLLSQNSDASWNIVSTSTWQALDCPGGSTTQNLSMIQWQPTRASNQRWLIDQQSNGTYKIWNQQSGLALDGSSSTGNGSPLTQAAYNGGPQQLWFLQ